MQTRCSSGFIIAERRCPIRCVIGGRRGRGRLQKWRPGHQKEKHGSRGPWHSECLSRRVLEPSLKADPARAWGRTQNTVASLARNVATRYLIIGADTLVGLLLMPF